MIGALITAAATIAAAVIAAVAMSGNDGKPAAQPGPVAVTSAAPPSASPTPSPVGSKPVQSLPVQSPAPKVSKNARIEASPDSGSHGTVVTLTGSGFAAGERVRLVFNGSYGKEWQLRDVTASADGGFVAEIKVPAEGVDDQQRSVDAKGLDSNRRADTPFTITE
ncbi:IPT/TIG domain-containing protein [Streptomyces sp. NPDC040724]|uniref:IPT/TIG domain-containing protein n=1 Tax=Streptomyces sp. NPDC040724 TaxID=3155612 RepID=UPI0033C6A40A